MDASNNPIKGVARNHLFDDWPDDYFKKEPYTINDVIDILRAKGYQAEILKPREEQTICFKVDDVPFYIEMYHLPSLSFELDLPIRHKEMPLDKIVQIAHDTTRDSFLAKVLVFPDEDRDYDAISFHAECIIDSRKHLRDNMERYINILIATASRFFDNIKSATSKA